MSSIIIASTFNCLAIVSTCGRCVVAGGKVTNILLFPIVSKRKKRLPIGVRTVNNTFAIREAAVISALVVIIVVIPAAVIVVVVVTGNAVVIVVVVVIAAAVILSVVVITAVILVVVVIAGIVIAVVIMPTMLIRKLMPTAATVAILWEYSRDTAANISGAKVSPPFCVCLSPIVQA